MKDDASPFSPSFKALLGINFLVWFAGYQVFPLIPLHLRSLGAGLAESGHFSALLTVGTATGALLMGRLGDRVGQARLLRFCGLLVCLMLASYPLMKSPLVFLIAAPFHGLIWAGMKTSAMGLAASLLPENDRVKGISLFGLSGALGVSLGPMTGLALEPIIHFGPLLGILSACFLIPALAPGLPKTDHSSLKASAAGPWPGKVLLPMALLLLAWGFAQGSLPPYSPQEAKFLGMGWPAALLTLHAVGMLISRGAFGFLSHGITPQRALPFLGGGGLLAMLCLGLLPGGLYRHMIGGLIFGGCMGLAHSLLFAEAVRKSGARHGEGVGLMYLAYESGMGIGAAAIGQVMEVASRQFNPGVGFRVGWLAAGMLLLVSMGVQAAQCRKQTKVGVGN